ncbi:gliding motility-associated C-terminal domain-containing protein [Labilibacter sediminis]|nr:gliding motility-associated C-terminal domain-containing protein [Labilibacter sediminis]
MKLRLFVLFLTIYLPSYFLFSQEPSAEVVSGDAAFCESGMATFTVNFTGEAPFAFAYRIGGFIYTEDGGGIFENSYSLNLSISSTSDIILERVYDNTPGYQLDPDNPLGSGSDNVSGSMHVRIDEMPVPFAGANDENCGLSYELKGTVTDPNHTIWWTDMTGQGSFDDVDSPTAVFTGNNKGLYKLTLNEKNGECSAASNVDINLLGSPTANIASVTSSFCSTDGIDDYADVDITFSGVGDFTYVMQNNSQTYPPETTSNTSEIATYLVTRSETFTLLSVQDGNGCFAEQADLTGQKEAVDRKPETFAGDDVVECSKEYTLQATLSDGASGQWIVNPDDQLQIGLISDPNTIVSSEVYQVATLIWQEDRDGCINSDEVTINFAEPPVIKLVETDDQICIGSISPMEVSLEGNAPWSFTYTDGLKVETESNISSSNHTVDVNPVVDTNYEITQVKGGFGCVSNPVDLFYNVLVDEMPETNAGEDDEVCGQSYVLNATASIGNGTWSGLGDFDEVSNPNTTVKVIEFGEKVFTWTEVNGMCSDADQVVIDFIASPEPVNAGEDTIIYATDNYTLQALDFNDQSKDEGVIGTWTLEFGSADIEFENVYNSRLLNIKTGEHHLRWTASIPGSSCPDIYDEVKIVAKELFTPTGFSPNGDLLNETFMILGAGNITKNKLTVFDINGKKVFSAEDYKNDWKGTDAGGEDLPVGTYYYVFEGDQLSKPIKNYLIIKR